MFNNLKLLFSNNKTLKDSEARYRRLFETAKDGILLLNAETAQIEDVNPFLIELLGYSYGEFMGKKIWEIGAFKDTVMNKEAFAELQDKGFIRYSDLPLVGKEGQHFSVEFVSNVYDCGGVEVIQCIIRDNTKRHLAELALKATTRALKMLSESNTALLSSGTELILVKEYCRIVVESGGYLMAWVGLADKGQDKNVIPIACYGKDDGYLELAKISWADTERGSGPTGLAIRSGQIQFVDDININPSVAIWRTEALKRGYLSAIAAPFVLPNNRTACLTLYCPSTNNWSSGEQKLLQEITADLSFGGQAIDAALSKLHYQANLRESLEQTIQILAYTVGERDPYTAGHQRRVAGICTQIAKDLGLSADFSHGLHLAATIHDLGKIGIPYEILSKPRRLTATEFELVKEHVNIAYTILKDVVFNWPITQIIHQHHERIDGSGYPLGLKGDELLLESKIIMVADVVEAMASHRPYRAALGIEVALSEIAKQRGISLDAQVVDSCLRVFKEQGYVIEE